MDQDLQATLVPVPRQFRWSFLPILRYPLRTFPGAEAAPADLGRWAFPGRAATYGPAWRWLAPGRRRRRLAVAAERDARPSRHPEAADRGRGARFLGADDLLQGTSLRHRHSIAGRIPPTVLRPAGRDRERHSKFLGDRRA